MTKPKEVVYIQSDRHVRGICKLIFKTGFSKPSAYSCSSDEVKYDHDHPDIERGPVLTHAAQLDPTFGEIDRLFDAYYCNASCSVFFRKATTTRLRDHQIPRFLCTDAAYTFYEALSQRFMASTQCNLQRNLTVLSRLAPQGVICRSHRAIV